jgi:hypothetical protein
MTAESSLLRDPGVAPYYLSGLLYSRVALLTGAVRWLVACWSRVAVPSFLSGTGHGHGGATAVRRFAGPSTEVRQLQAPDRDVLR